MRVKRLLELSQGRVIAESSFNGRILFDNFKNTESHIKKYYDFGVLTICGDVVAKRGRYDWYSDIYPTLRIIITHNTVEE